MYTSMQQLRTKVSNNERGFTLVELLIVVAIIGILAAIAVPQFAAYRVRGFNSSAQSDTRNLATSEAAFFTDWQVFGVSNNAAAAGGGAGLALLGPSAVATHMITAAAGNPAVNRTLPITVGRGITLVAHTNAANSAFTGGAKHLLGSTVYGIDSDTAQLYQNPTGVATGTAIVAGDVPASTTPADDIAAAGAPWVSL